MLRAAPSVMDSAALFLLYIITKLQNLKAIHNLFLVLSPDNEYIVAQCIAKPCGCYKARLPPELLYCPDGKVRQAAFFRQLQTSVKSLLTQLP